VAHPLRLALQGARQGVSKSTVSKIWRSHNLKPPRVKGFKWSRAAYFLEKLTDVVGLYLNPPQQALMLCVDEKSQIQALDRTQPGLPLKQRRCGTMTNDYKLIWSDLTSSPFSVGRSVPFLGLAVYSFLLRGSKTTDEAGRFDDESI